MALPAAELVVRQLAACCQGVGAAVDHESASAGRSALYDCQIAADVGISSREYGEYSVVSTVQASQV